MNKLGENLEKKNIFLPIIPARSEFLLLHNILGTNVITLTSFRSELLHGGNLDIYEYMGFST